MEQIVHFTFQVLIAQIAGVIFFTTFGKYWRMNVHSCNNRFKKTKMKQHCIKHENGKNIEAT